MTGKTRNKETLQTSTPEAPARRQGRSIKTQDRRAGGAAAQNFSGEKGGASTWPLDPRGHGTEKTPPTKHALQRSPVRAQPTREDWPRYRPTFKCRTPSPADVPRAHFPALHRPRRALLSCSHCNRLTAFEHSHPSSYNTLQVRGPAWVSQAKVQGSARCIHSGGSPGENPFPAHPGR